MVRILKNLIVVYQSFSCHLFPNACRFHPSCSQYALEAIEKYGVIKGLGMACVRIGRCSPFFKGGYDPVK